MADALVISDTVRIPARALSLRAVRASGPGGQNVNRVATKVELRVDLDAIEGLSDAARARLAALARPRLGADGRLLVTSQATRNQGRNLEDARAKVAALVRASLVRPRRRLPTAPTTGAEERRIATKRRRAEVKRGRAAPGADD
jgi:ribosome-associated protein